MAYEGYYAVLRKDVASGAIIVSFPDLPHVNTFGDSWEHAAEMAEDALNQTLIVAFERGTKIPEAPRRPRRTRGRQIEFVRLRPEVRMAFLLRDWRAQAGMAQKDMARAMGMSYQAYQRMERPGRANLSVRTLERIARALGKRCVVEMR